MRESRAHFDAHKYTPSPEEAIEIANRRFTVANARSAIDVVFAFKAQSGNRTFLPLPGLDYGNAEDQMGIIRLLGSIWTSGYVAGIRSERARRRGEVEQQNRGRRPVRPPVFAPEISPIFSPKSFVSL